MYLPWAFLLYEAEFEKRVINPDNCFEMIKLIQHGSFSFLSGRDNFKFLIVINR